MGPCMMQVPSPEQGPITEERETQEGGVNEVRIHSEDA
jgi:hypothetical protein